MPLVWCSISGHGFGHGAQVVPVLNELGRRVPRLRVLLRTTIPESFFQETLLIPWEYSQSEQGIGCVQDGPLVIDIPKTWEAYEQFHANWQTRVLEEAQAIRSVKPDLLLSNISYLGVASGREAGCPTVALASLSWDQIMNQYIDKNSSKQEAIVAEIREAYGRTGMLIRAFPGIPMVAFSEVKDVGPLLSPYVQAQGVLRRQLRMDVGERLVLVAFGGIPLSFLPLEQLDAIKGYRFVISGAFDCHGYTRITSTKAIGLSFREILAEADVVMTKPGYATIVEAVRSQMLIVYVRRYNFADEQSLVDFAHRYGRAIELSLEDFETGRWRHTLESVQIIPAPRELMPPEGTGAAADHIAAFL